MKKRREKKYVHIHNNMKSKYVENIKKVLLHIYVTG